MLFRLDSLSSCNDNWSRLIEGCDVSSVSLGGVDIGVKNSSVRINWKVDNDCLTYLNTGILNKENYNYSDQTI